MGIIIRVWSFDIRVTDYLELLFWFCPLSELANTINEQTGTHSQLCGTESRSDFIPYSSEDRQKTNFQNPVVLIVKWWGKPKMIVLSIYYHAAHHTKYDWILGVYRNHHAKDMPLNETDILAQGPNNYFSWGKTKLICNWLHGLNEQEKKIHNGFLAGFIQLTLTYSYGIQKTCYHVHKDLPLSTYHKPVGYTPIHYFPFLIQFFHLCLVPQVQSLCPFPDLRPNPSSTQTPVWCFVICCF